MGLVKRFTLEEREIIEELIKSGKSITGISVFLKRSKNGLSSELNKNGGRVNYNAKNAHERHLKTKYIKHQKLSKKFEGKIFESNGLISRIENIEMQIEIILDLVKELKK